MADEEIEVARSAADQADALLDTDARTLVAVLWGDRRLDDAELSGDMAIEGDKTAAKRFIRLFPTPEPAPAAGPR